MKKLSYLNAVWKARYFWFHLAMSDVRAKYRRSLLGLVWAVIQPLMLTLLLSFVMGHILHVPIKEYAPFIFSGIIVWEFIMNFMMSSCTAFINAESYIKQCKHPLLIYTLRTVIYSIINFLCGLIGLLIAILIFKPYNFGFSWLNLFPALIVLFFFAWPLSTINAFIATRFRDYSQLLSIFLQALYYISPIFFLPKLFAAAHLEYVLEYNPIYHLLNLFRMPLLEGIPPSFNDYLFVIALSLFLWFCSWVTIRNNEKKILFHL